MPLTAFHQARDSYHLGSQHGQRLGRLGPDRTGPTAQHLCGLLHAQILEIAQYDHGPLPRPEQFDSLAHAREWFDAGPGSGGGPPARYGGGGRRR